MNDNYIQSLNLKMQNHTSKFKIINQAKSALIVLFRESRSFLTLKCHFRLGSRLDSAKRAARQVEICILIFAFMLILPIRADASLLRQLPLSARLTTSSGNNVTDGSYTMRFRIYDASTGGSVLWEETKTVSATAGVFSTLLGSVTSLDSVSFDRDDLYLGIKVGADDEMTPRKRVAPSPSALNSDKLDGMDTSASGGASVIPITDASGNLTLGNSNLSVGTGSLTVGAITSSGTIATTGALQAAAGTFSGAVTIQGSATVSGNLTVGGSSVLGTSGSNLSVSSSVVPTASGLNLGSSASHWASLYVDDLIVGGAGLSSTAAEYYSVNSDATTDQTGGYRIYRGPTVNSYATLQWNTTDTGFRLLSNEGATTYGKLTMGALTATTGTFTSTVTIPTPFTLGSTSVTSTGTQLNYLASATGTTGTTSTNLVFSTSPTLVTPALGTPTALVLTNATGLPASSVLAGTFGTGAYTMDTTLTVPTLLGGTATTSDLFLKTTSGVGTTGADMHFLVGNNGATEAMTILNAGNVGIGTTSPAVKLDVYGNVANNYPNNLGAHFTNTNSGGRADIINYNDTGESAVYSVFGSAFGVSGYSNNTQLGASKSLFLVSDAQVANGGSADIRFLTGGYTLTTQERMRITSTGNVGIGTTSPGAKLHASSSAASTWPVTITSVAEAYGTGNGSHDVYNPKGVALHISSANPINDAAVLINFDMQNATTYNSGGYIGMVSNNTTGQRANMVFGQRTAVSTWAEAMRIDTSGNVGIGTTSPNSTLHVAGPIATAIATKVVADSPYTATASNSTILANAVDGAITINLPTAVGISGRQYIIKKTDSSVNAVTVDGNASETIDGATTYSLATQWKYVTVQSDGANWVVIANN